MYMSGKNLLDTRNYKYDIYPDDALCAQLVNPDQATYEFFPERNGAYGQESNTATGFAKKVCSLCQVQGDCLKESEGEKGMWAGLGDRARRNLNNRKPQDP